MTERIGALEEDLRAITHYNAAVYALRWGAQMDVPPKGRAARGELTAFLMAEQHKRLTSPGLHDTVNDLMNPATFGNLSADDQVIVNRAHRDIERAHRVPPPFVQELGRLTSEASRVWAAAREENNFAIFQPYLQRIIDMKRRQAEYLGYETNDEGKGSPYDALLQEYEPGMTCQQFDAVLNPLVEQLAPLIRSVQGVPMPPAPAGRYDIRLQRLLNERVVADLGYDLQAGRIDEAIHPFTTGLHPTDARITTRYNLNNFMESLLIQMHEAGHGMYEQGLPVRHYGTPLGKAASYSIHESQSRLWETMVGRSPQFIKGYLYPLLKNVFEHIDIGEEQLYGWVNRIAPGPIRVNADPATYHMHIALRYWLERRLIEGELAVRDVPEAWDAYMQQLLGVQINNDAEGVLQDVHWSQGDMGYFSTYTSGTSFAAQLYHYARQNISGLEDGFSRGEFAPLLEWLRQHVHQHGQRYDSDELIQKATGEPPSSQYLLDHVRSIVKMHISAQQP